MTPKQAQELLPVIQAFSMGAQIQCQERRPQSIWKDVTDPTWIEGVNYRIKPQRARVWLNNYSNTLVVCKENNWESTENTKVSFGGWKSEPFDLTED